MGCPLAAHPPLLTAAAHGTISAAVSTGAILRLCYGAAATPANRRKASVMWRRVSRWKIFKKWEQVGFRIPAPAVLIGLLAVGVAVARWGWIGSAVQACLFVAGIWWVDLRARDRDWRQESRERQQEARERSKPGPPMGEQLLSCLQRCSDARSRLASISNPSFDIAPAMQHLDAFEALILESIAADIVRNNHFWMGHFSLHSAARRPLPKDHMRADDISSRLAEWMAEHPP